MKKLFESNPIKIGIARMNIQLTFKINLLADYHVSDGQRIGLSIDSALLRDYAQRPVLRGTALAGLLKDGFEDLRDTLVANNLHDHRLSDAVASRLFGEPGQRKQWAFSSTQLLNNNQDNAHSRWGAIDVTRVRINPRTRRAAPQQLFNEEEGDARLQFCFTAACYGLADQVRADAAALVAAARMVRHLGAARRRGRGHCHIELIDAKNFLVAPQGDETWTGQALAAFRSYWLDHKELPSAPETVASPSSNPDNTPKRLRLIAQLQEPVIIANKSEVANAFETIDTIPGTTLLGALAARAAHQLDLDNDPNAQAQFANLFLRGDITASGLLPAQYESERNRLFPLIPAPKSWIQCENYPQFGSQAVAKFHPKIDRATADKTPRTCPHDANGASCGGKLKKVAGFINSDRSKNHWRSEPVKTRDEVHIRMQRETGRANEGDLFTYKALEAGQWFVGEIDCAAGAWEQLRQLTGIDLNQRCEMRLGKATQRGYGLVHFVLEELEEDDVGSWLFEDISYRLPEKLPENLQLDLTLLFLTDTILWDRWGRFQHTFTKQSLAELLALSADNIVKIRPFLSSRIVESFNTHRQIPRWRDEAIEAGSVVRFTVKVDDLEVLKTRLEKLERDGIGLRRHEGFGRIAFNHPLFQEDADPDGLQLDVVLPHLKTKKGKDQLLIEREAFRHSWQEMVDNSRFGSQSGKIWREEMGEAYEAVARLLFVQRYQPLADIQAWLHEKEGNPTKLGQAKTLWGKKTLTGREGKTLVSGSALTLINALVTQLETHPATHHPLGLEILAAQIAAQVNDNRGGSDNG